jgi:hypothetical protein
MVYIGCCCFFSVACCVSCSIRRSAVPCHAVPCRGFAAHRQTSRPTALRCPTRSSRALTGSDHRQAHEAHHVRRVEHREQARARVGRPAGPSWSVPAQMWGRSRRRCGAGAGADVGQVPAQMWGRSRAQMWGQVPAQMWGRSRAQMWGQVPAQMWGAGPGADAAACSPGKCGFSLGASGIGPV